ncbi:MAG: glycosyltransferase [Anaerolineales bacterium]|nr:glycosyltransferase [Anaerolineales bacterium]
MKIALVHDWLNQNGGAEYVLETLVGLYPSAPVYTSIFQPKVMPEAMRRWDIRTTFLDNWPLIKDHHQAFLPFYPMAFESLDLSDYNLVLSNKSGFCHGAITGPDTVHICYCLTPTRYLWEFERYAQREHLGSLKRSVLLPFLNYLRMWDRLAADRVDHFIAISETVKRRIAKYYRRDSVVIYPPVNTGRFVPAGKTDDFYLTVSRLVPYKRVDLAVQAAGRLDRPLVIVGEGRDRPRLEAMAGSNVTFTGRLPESELADVLARCRAFVFPGVDDFGIAPVEAMAAGRPVIAFAGGGALDTVVEGQTGLFFRELSTESLAATIEQFETLDFDSDAIRRHAQQFDRTVFEARMAAFVENAGS